LQRLAEVAARAAAGAAVAARTPCWRGSAGLQPDSAVRR